MVQEKIVSLIQNNQKEAFTQLYDSYAQSLFGIISNLTSNPEEAEDILQDVFVKIWKNIDSYSENNERFYTWLVNITRETAIEKLKSKGYFSKKNLTTQNFVNLTDNNSKDSIGIREFVKKMKPLHIKLIDCLFFKGFSLQEASEELEIPVTTLKSENRNSISELKNLLKQL